MRDWYVVVRLSCNVDNFDIEKYSSIIRNNDGVVYMVSTTEETVNIDFKCNADIARSVDAELKQDSNVYAHMIARK